MSLADQASLLLIPSGYKSQKVYSIFPTDGDGDFNFSRSGSATRIAKNGLITTVDSNVPRLEYPLIDGVVNGCPSLKLEPQSTNLLPYSEDFSQSNWTKSGASVTSGFTSPDGTANALKLVETNSLSSHFIYNQPISATIGNKYSFSIFAKKGERDYIVLGTQTSIDTYFNLSTGVITSSPVGVTSTITSLVNGYYKCSITWTATASTESIYIYNTANGTTRTSYQGDGTSGVYIWGAQLEGSNGLGTFDGSYPTSYIKSNSGSPTTRSAETANGSGDAATFNDSEGVLMAEISALADDGTVRSIAISGSVTNDVVRIYYDGVSNGLTAFVYDGAYQTVFTTVLNNITENNKIAFSYKLNQFKLFINGLQIGSTDVSGNVPNGLNTLSFDNGYGLEDFYGKTKQIQYYNSALTDSELEKISSWTSFSDMANGQQYSII